MSTANWTSAVYTKDFWTDYIFLTDYKVDYFFQIHLQVTKRYSLIVDIQSEERTLSLFDQKNKKELGYIDTDDQYFCVFRREELEALSQAIGKDYFENPNIPFLLLDLFTPTTLENDFNMTWTKLASTWRSLNIFTDKELEKLLDNYYRKRWAIEKDFSWEHIPSLGWALRNQYNDYSLRVSQNSPYRKRFPFKEFKNILQDLS